MEPCAAPVGRLRFSRARLSLSILQRSRPGSAMNFLRRHWFIIALIAIVGAVRFVILFLSQTHVHSDEAIIGLMGKHIAEGRYFPFYMYGQPYNAGAAWEAYCAAIPFKLFGVGVVPFKSCIVILSLVWLFLFYKMAQTLYDERTAQFAALV